MGDSRVHGGGRLMRLAGSTMGNRARIRASINKPEKACRGLLPCMPDWAQTHPQDGKFDRHKALAPSRKIVKDSKENGVPHGYKVVLVFSWQGGRQLDSFYSCVS
jgi:hypothetical protein